MNLGYDKALYRLSFDHRQSHVSDMFHLEPPPTVPQRDQMVDSKQLICEGLKRALTEGVPFEAAGIVVDEQFGAAILRDARQRGCSDDPLARSGGNKDAFDRQARPLPMQQPLQALQDAGFEPDVWQVEGQDSPADADGDGDGERMLQIARRAGCDQVGVVLGRGADEAKARRWVTVAAGVPGIVGFAVGRTSFLDAVAGYLAQTLPRAEAATQIAGRLCEWVDVFGAGRRSHPTGAA